MSEPYPEPSSLEPDKLRLSPNGTELMVEVELYLGALEELNEFIEQSDKNVFLAVKSKKPDEQRQLYEQALDGYLQAVNLVEALKIEMDPRETCILNLKIQALYNKLATCDGGTDALMVNALMESAEGCHESLLETVITNPQIGTDDLLARIFSEGATTFAIRAEFDDSPIRNEVKHTVDLDNARIGLVTANQYAQLATLSPSLQARLEKLDSLLDTSYDGNRKKELQDMTRRSLQELLFLVLD